MSFKKFAPLMLSLMILIGIFMIAEPTKAAANFGESESAAVTLQTASSATSSAVKKKATKKQNKKAVKSKKNKKKKTAKAKKAKQKKQ